MPRVGAMFVCDFYVGWPKYSYRFTLLHDFGRDAHRIERIWPFLEYERLVPFISARLGAGTI
jgi:hypothetical protein